MGICGFSWRFSLLLVSGGSGCWCTSDDADCLGLTTRKADASATPRLEKSSGPTPTGECCCCTSIILDLESVHRFTTFASLHTTFASPPPARFQFLSFLSNKQIYTVFPNLISNKAIQKIFSRSLADPSLGILQIFKEKLRDNLQRTCVFRNNNFSTIIVTIRLVTF